MNGILRYVLEVENFSYDKSFKLTAIVFGVLYLYFDFCGEKCLNPNKLNMSS